MYKVVYTKTAAKDVPKLKSAHLDEKRQRHSLKSSVLILSKTRPRTKSWWVI